MENFPNPEHEWVAQTLGSLEGSTRPEPSPWLYQQVRQRLEARQAATAAEAPARSWVLARVALAVVLAAANLVTFAYRASFTPAETTTPAVAEYAYPTLTSIN